MVHVLVGAGTIPEVKEAAYQEEMGAEEFGLEVDSRGCTTINFDTKTQLGKWRNLMNPERDLNFGKALAWLRAGRRMSREGWNGKNQYVVYQKAYPDGIPINANTAEATGIPLGTVCKFLPYLMIRTVQGDFVPWLASQTDILAEDWMMADAED